LKVVLWSNHACLPASEPDPFQTTSDRRRAWARDWGDWVDHRSGLLQHFEGALVSWGCWRYL